jgi:superfamily I DNA/RNA helicase
MAPEVDLLTTDRGLVVAPAGCGKTQLIIEGLARYQGERPILVLTHTNAGVAALRGRLERAGVSGRLYRLATIDGWAMRLIATYPERAGHDANILLNPNYPRIRDAAIRLVTSGHIDDIIRATYSRLIVDEYQDCSGRQHTLVCALSGLLGTVVLGDDLQALSSPLPKTTQSRGGRKSSRISRWSLSSQFRIGGLTLAPNSGSSISGTSCKPEASSI